jgi:hypothetical protein
MHPVPRNARKRTLSALGIKGSKPSAFAYACMPEWYGATYAFRQAHEFPDAAGVLRQVRAARAIMADEAHILRHGTLLAVENRPSRGGGDVRNRVRGAPLLKMMLVRPGRAQKGGFTYYSQRSRNLRRSGDVVRAVAVETWGRPK